MTNFVIETVNLCKYYQNSLALNNINLQIKPGEFISILGPSGSGKTTLLRILAGLEYACEGQILLDNKDITKLEPYKRPVNMVFQNYALFPHMNVFENIAFGLKIAKKNNKLKIKETVHNALNLVKLSNFDNRYPNQLSGGQQQRVAIARAIVNEPLVLLLDEPLSALDQQIRDEMKDELIYLQKQLNMTFIMVTHDQSDALSLSKRIAVINNGNLEQFANAHEIYNEPKTKFIAKFIGNTNLFSATTKNVDNGILTVSFNSDICFDIKRNECNDTNLTVCIRFEKIKITKEASDHLPNLIKAVVVQSQYQGNYTVHLLKVADNLLLKSIDNSCSVYEPDTQVWLSVNPDDIFTFGN